MHCGWIVTPYFKDIGKGLIRRKTIPNNFLRLFSDSAFHIFPQRSIKVVISNQCHRETLIIFDWGGREITHGSRRDNYSIGINAGTLKYKHKCVDTAD